MMHNLQFRKFDVNDSQLLWEWVNDPVVRENSFNQGYITWDEHCDWLHRITKRKRTALYIVSLSTGEKVGQIRFEGKEVNNVSIDISIAKEWRGHSLGFDIVRQGMALYGSQYPVSRFVAEIKETNAISKALFRRSGFTSSISGIKNSIPYVECEYRVSTYIIASHHSWSDNALQTIQQRVPGRWVLISESDDLTDERLYDLNPRYIFFTHWSQMVPESLYEKYPCICFHMTDLPYGRGGTPLQNLLLRDKSETVLTAFRMVGELDAGPVYIKTKMPLTGSAQEIYQRASEIAFSMIERIIYENISPIPQKGDVTIFKRRKPSESRIQSPESLRKLYDLIRMVDADGYPRAFIEKDGYRYEFSNANYQKNEIIAQVRITKK